MTRGRSRDSGCVSMNNHRARECPIECERQIRDRGWSPHREECNTLHGDPAGGAWPCGGKPVPCIARDVWRQRGGGTGAQALQVPGFLGQCEEAMQKCVVFNEMPRCGV